MTSAFSSVRLWLLFRTLNSKQHWTRRRDAARTLGEIQDPRALWHLLLALRTNLPLPEGRIPASARWAGLTTPIISVDEDAERYLVREEAARALGRIGDRRAVPALASALEDEAVSVRIAAAKALGQLADPEGVPPLVTLLRSHHPDLRAAAVSALIELGEQGVRWILPMLSQGAFEARESAAQALGLIGGPKALAGLCAALADRDYSVRRAVVQALADIGNTALEPLLPMLADRRSEVRLACIRALARLQQPRAIEPLRDQLRDDNPEIRQALWKALAQLEWPPALQRERVLRGVQADDFRAVQEAGADAVDPLIECWHLGDRDARQRIEGWLARLGADAVPPLVDALDDPDQDCRRLMVALLQKQGWSPDKDVDTVRFELASGHHPAAATFGEIAIAPLARFLSDRSEWERRLAAKALGTIPHERALDALLSAAADESYLVREAVANSLGEFANSHPARTALQAALQDPHMNVRTAASQALNRTSTSAGPTEPPHS